MGTRTYYEILGVSRDATLEEITSAKNALAKVYHPDANMQNDIDTTAYMQEILEATGYYPIRTNGKNITKNYLESSSGFSVLIP